MSEAPQAQLIEQTEAFEQQLHPVLGEVGQKPGSGRRVGKDADHVVLGEPPTEATRLRRQVGGAERAAKAAEASQHHLVVVGRPRHLAADQPGEETRAVAPGRVAVAARQEDHQRHPAAAMPEDLDHQPVAPEHPIGRDLPVAERIIGGGVGTGNIDDQAGTHLHHHVRQGLEQRAQIDLVADVGAEGNCGRGLRVGVSPVIVVDRIGVDR